MKEELFESILSEADKSYKAKVGGKWLKGNGFTDKEKNADTFESKTEPTQRINQMKKDGKISKNAKVSTKEISESQKELFDNGFHRTYSVNNHDILINCHSSRSPSS